MSKLVNVFLLDDGKLIFEVLATDGEAEVKAKVVQGGPLKSKKGVNLPNTDISLPALTEKDVKDAIFAIEQKVDWIALSFVRFSSRFDRSSKVDQKAYLIIKFLSSLKSKSLRL